MPRRSFRYTDDMSPPATSVNETIFVACRIAAKYPATIPAAADLMRSFGMSRSTAYRWVASIKDARGVARGEA